MNVVQTVNLHTHLEHNNVLTQASRELPISSASIKKAYTLCHGAGLVLDQTPANPDIRPATARGGVDTHGTHLGFIPRSLQLSAHRI